ncbi:MAG: hypothetical protein HY909_20240 [Deltaproteobacteria bacterium]|nr:hypothetical protein [Deltaproteobacteria bacterium]
MNTPWQPTNTVDLVLRFGGDFGPALRAMLQNALGSALDPEGRAREGLRVLARAVGTATHAYIGGASPHALTGVRLPTNADDDGELLGIRLRLGTYMNTPVDASNGAQVQGLLQALLGLPRGSIVAAEALTLAPSREAQAPVLSTLNPRTLPGQKLCAYCRNPMPAYEVQCSSCGARAES